MPSPGDSHREPETPYVSTGQLPQPGVVQALVDDAYERFRPNREGQLSGVYPALAAASPDAFGICLTGTAGMSTPPVPRIRSSH